MKVLKKSIGSYEVIQDSNRSVNPQIIEPVTIKDVAPVSGLGTVSQIPGGAIVTQNFETVISWFYLNGGVAPASVMFFDPTGIVADKFGVTADDPTSGNIGSVAAVWNAYLLTRQYVFKGFNYSVSQQTMLALAINIGTASGSGRNAIELIPSSFRRNTAQDRELLTFEGEILVTAATGIWIDNVPNGESVSLDFYGGINFDGFATMQR